MGRTSNLSIMGLYNWDPTIFELLQLPPQINRDTVIKNLLAETAELEVLYPNPVVFKNLVGIWSGKEREMWERLYATTQYEYNPIENYDRYETGTDSGTGRRTHSGTDTTTETETHSGTDTTNISRREGGSETENSTSSFEQGGQDEVTGADTKGHWVAGFDAQASGQDDGLVKQTRDQDDATSTTEYGKTEDGSGSRTTSFGKTNTDTESIQHGETIGKTGGFTHGEQVSTANDSEHELHIHGNIGVTTTQEMIRQERDIDRYNLYDIIIEDFKMRFCILIY